METVTQQIEDFNKEIELKQEFGVELYDNRLGITVGLARRNNRRMSTVSVEMNRFGE